MLDELLSDGVTLAEAHEGATGLREARLAGHCRVSGEPGGVGRAERGGRFAPRRGEEASGGEGVDEGVDIPAGLGLIEDEGQGLIDGLAEALGLTRGELGEEVAGHRWILPGHHGNAAETPTGNDDGGRFKARERASTADGAWYA